MATLIQGDIDTFSGVTLGQYHAGTIDFLQNAPKIATTQLRESGQRFWEAAKELVAKSSIDTTLRKMRAAARQVAAVFQTDEIRELKTVAEQQNAPITMRHLIMANPQIRTWYHNQTIEGYHGSYVDREPGLVGEDHYDYRRVQNGIIEETEDGFMATQYFEDVAEGDELFFDQQVEVKITWQNVINNILRGQDDPTSRWNAAL